MTSRSAGGATIGGAVRSEGTVSSSTRRGSDAKRLAYLEKIAQSYAGIDATLDLESLKKLAEKGEQQTSSRQQDVSSENSEFDAVDNKISMQPLQDNITHYSGEFSHWNFSMRIKNWIDEGLPAVDQNQPAKSTTTKFKEYYRPEELQSSSSTLNLLSLLPPRAITDFLVHCFFRHAEANYFYVQRDWLIVQLDLAYQNPASFAHRGVGTVCIIFILLAIGTQYAYLESLTEPPDNTPRNQEAKAGRFSEDSIGVTFYQQACRLLPDVMAVSSLESVQACLLMGIYTLPWDACGLSYTYLNLALNLAIVNGMHRRYPSETGDVELREMRNRVWWTVYTIEKRVGIFHGRPRSIAGIDVDATLPTDGTDIWPSSTPSHGSHALATIQLNLHLDKIAQEMSVLRTRQRSELLDTLTKLVNLQHGLHRWWDGLPSDANFKEPISLSDVSRQCLHLKLEYCLVRMYVGRVFILTHERRLSNSSPDSAADTPGMLSNKKRLRSILVTDCIEAALSVMDTCRVIRSTIGLARASYTEFSSCRAALLVITTQCLHKRTYRFRQALRDGLAMLKEMASGSESFNSEASLIEAFERAIAKIDMIGSTASTGGEGPDSDYARFKRWEQHWKGDSSLLDAAADRPSGDASAPPVLLDSNKQDEGIFGQSTAPISSFAPFFGVDGNFASFPQSLDDFTSFFGEQFGSTFDAEPT